jgi:hypothetical protein
MLNLLRRLYCKVADALRGLSFRKKKAKPKGHPDIYPLW